ncbi:MAG TPA: BTAD domain-containing putative transcriptional regulator [Acetobacteraceae bacterium]|nr:BTAD domain-containing putative transcriptional regulator [Acetobacteraceae bacterium]
MAAASDLRLDPAPESASIRLRLTLIGRMDAWSLTGDRVLPRSRKARGVLAILALESPVSVLRGRLAALLWSRRGEEQARGSLRQALHELQESLRPVGAPLIRAGREAVMLNADLVWTDATEILGAARERPEHLDLIDSELLSDMEGLDPAFDSWLAERRLLFREAALRAAMLSLSAARGQTATIAAARRVLALDDTHEPAWRALIRAEAERGDRAAALASWEQCQRSFAARFRAPPSGPTAALVEELRRDAPLPPPAALHAPPRRPATRGARLGVLPLRATAEDSHLALGLAEEITAALARFRWLTLFDSASLRAQTEAAGPARNAAMEVARTTGLDFALTGTVQRSGERVRASLRLTDLRQPETVVWARRFERSSADLMALQDDIAAEVVAQIDPEVLIIEAKRAAARPSVQPSAYDHLLRAIPAIYRMDRESYLEAGRLLEQAIATEPDYGPAHAWLAYWHIFLVGQGWAADNAEVFGRAEDAARRAVVLDPNDAQALTILGHVRAFFHHRIEEAVALHERALALNPNLAMAWAFSGMAHAYRGEHEEALGHCAHYKRLAPFHPHAFIFDSGQLIPLLFLGRHEEVDRAAREVTLLHPAFSFPYKLWLPALGHLGRAEEAARVRARLLEIEPDFTIAKAMRRGPIQRAEDRAHYEEGLRLAGLT